MRLLAVPAPVQISADHDELSLLLRIPDNRVRNRTAKAIGNNGRGPITFL
jgi:hypothetical protein